MGGNQLNKRVLISHTTCDLVDSFSVVVVIVFGQLTDGFEANVNQKNKNVN